MDELFDRLTQAGQALGDSLKVAMILRSLPDSYSGLVTALESRPDADLTVTLVKSKLLDEFERRKERSGSSGRSGDVNALKTFSNRSVSGSDRTCFFCKQVGHMKKDCPVLQKQKGRKKKKNEPTTVKQAVAEVRSKERSAVLFLVDSVRSSGWIIDSGASKHMCNDRKCFVSIDENDVQEVILADGRSVKSAGCGTVEVSSVNGHGEVVDVMLEKTLYVPSLNSGLLSVPMLTEKGFLVVFRQKECDITDAAGKVVAKGDRCGSLYRLRIAEEARQVESSVKSKQHNEHCQHQWHRKFGHRDPAAVSKLCKEELAEGVLVKDCGIRLECEICIEGKLSRAPIPHQAERKSTQVLDLVHTDLCGPTRTSTPSGSRYLMTVIDDYSRYTVVYLLRKKSEATDRLIEYVRYVETLFNRKPRVVRSDGGGEYVNERLQNFFNSEGIQYQYTTAYTPQQNGVAERRNRYLQEMATTMLLDAKLEKKYWGEAVVTAAYLQNRLPSRAVDVTPFEKWYGRKPNLGNLRVYGCKAWVHVPDVKRGKFDSKARKLTFIGYSEHHKGYRFVDLATEKVIISRDAKFMELEGPQNQEEKPRGASSCQEKPTKAVERAAEESFVELIPLTESTEKKAPPVAVPEEESVEPVQHEESDEPDNFDGNHSEHEQFFDLTSSFSDDPLAVKEEPENGEESEAVPTSSRQNRGKLPSRFSDYVVGVATQQVKEPATYDEAVKSVDGDAWRKAMDDELQSHSQNGTWELVNPPAGKRVIGSRWVFKIKQDETGAVVRFKSRLVAQGYAQRYGVDFDEVFAPVIKYATLRMFLVLAGKERLFLKHLDVKTAYLYGRIDEEVYMRQPPGYAIPGQEEKVCRLKRSIYGLKQSARCWNRKLSDVLLKMGFVACNADPCMYVAARKGKKIYLVVYVDDLLVGCASEEEITTVRDELRKEFEICCLGDAKYFLGLELQKADDGFYCLSVQAYIEKLIVKLGLQEAKVAKTPMDQGYVKDKTTSATLKDASAYRSVVGAVMYIAVTARPDIASAASILGRKFSAPTEIDWTAAKRVVRYLKATKDWKLKLGGKDDMLLEAYSDSDWAGDPDTRKSTTGFVIFFAGGAVSWASRRQNCVSLSSMEAEYVALVETCQDVLWLRRLLADMGEEQKCATIVHEDNQGCLCFVKSERASKRTKHIETKECFIKDLCDRGLVELQYCPTDEMKADILTKALGTVKHDRFAVLLGIVKG